MSLDIHVLGDLVCLYGLSSTVQTVQIYWAQCVTQYCFHV